MGENFGKLIDHQQKLANNILVNAPHYFAHVIQDNGAVEKEHVSNSKASLTSMGLECRKHYFLAVYLCMHSLMKSWKMEPSYSVG